MQLAKRRKPVERVIRGLNSSDIAKVESLDFGKANRSMKKISFGDFDRYVTKHFA